MTQLLLPLELPPRFSFEDLVVHRGNEEALATIRSAYATVRKPLPSLFLHGPPGTGKTHMVQALGGLLEKRLKDAGGRVVLVKPQGEPARFPDLENLVSGDPEPVGELYAAAVDDVHLMDDEDSAHLWTLANQLTRSGGALILAGRVAPHRMFLDNPHLQSRVLSGLVLSLEAPEDPERMLILDKMARDRNVRVSRETFHYLLTRKSRNVKDLAELLDILDRASLELKRRITIPLIKSLEKEGLI
jgi:DnaA regulatory inactivator Hda